MKRTTRKSAGRTMRQAAIIVFGILLMGLAAGCGKEKEAVPDQEPPAQESQSKEQESGFGTNDKKSQGMEEHQKDQKDQADRTFSEERIIKDQTFDVELKPLGEVKFASYSPDTEQEPLADAEFVVWKDNKVSSILDGPFPDNIRSNESFNSVEAVSFPDYNSDGYNDIIIICSYSPSSGPDAGTGYSEARIFRGDAKGSFTFEKELSEQTNSALAEITVKSVLGFLGADRPMPVDAKSSWQQAYTDYLQAQDAGMWEGYRLIYIDEDDIPEIAAFGSSEAVGSKIISYGDGRVYETQLSRLNFSYIERGSLLCNSDGHMDSYYDVVYRMEHGQLTQIAAGYYGAQDNSNVQLDQDGEPIYQYQWEGELMSKEEYDKAFHAVYDTAKVKKESLVKEFYSADEIIEDINNI
ncbi:hypothetical protein [Diplocloster hominis]|uniref:hypothetical protein n=1 Tax=Diplocloster hominis TaxID=3079010 RepID=UPI0031BB0AA6